MDSLVPQLETLSWNTIAQISEMGLASQLFSVGDEKNVLINGVNYTFQIWGFNHDDLTSGGKAGITFGMKNLLANTYNMNNSDTNSTGWKNCLMRTSTMVTLLTQLPTDLQSVIKTVNKLTTAGNQSTSIQTSQDKLFLFSEREIDGTADTGYASEGTQYAYWVGKGTTDRIKRFSNDSGSTGYWWLRSPLVIGHDYFRDFSNSGDITHYPANFARGVCFDFCV